MSCRLSVPELPVVLVLVPRQEEGRPASVLRISVLDALASEMKRAKNR